MKKRSKKTFLLFEILIALSLMGMLISLLFSFLVQTMRVEKKMQLARSTILERQTVQVRLQDLLISLSPDSLRPTLYTKRFPEEEKESLVALFDNGIDPEPLFSGKVIGRIYLDKNHDLCLVYWPYNPMKNRPWRKEILCSNIEDVSFQFLETNEKMDPKDTGQAKSLWQQSLPKDMNRVPSIVRMSLKQQNTTFQFAFHIPNAEPVATYRSSA